MGRTRSLNGHGRTLLINKDNGPPVGLLDEAVERPWTEDLNKQICRGRLRKVRH